MKNPLIAVIAVAAAVSSLVVPSSAQRLPHQERVAILWDRPLISLTWQQVPAEIKPYFLDELQAEARRSDYLFKNRWHDLYKNIKELAPQEQEYWMERWWVVARMQAKDEAPRIASQVGADEDDVLELFEEDATKAGSSPVETRSAKGIATRASNFLDGTFFKPMEQAKYRHNMDGVKKK